MINIERHEFSNALNQCLKVGTRKTTMPILSSILVETVKRGKKGKVRLTATDLEVILQVTINAEIDKKAEFLLPLSNTAKAVKDMEPHEEFVFIEPFDDEGIMRIRMNDAVMHSPIPVSEFPEIPTFTDPSVFKAENLVRCLQKIVPAIATDALQYSLGAVCFNFKDSELVSTDGHRLHLIKRFQLKGDDPPKEDPLLLPSLAARLLSKWDRDPTILMADNKLRFIDGNVDLTARLVDSTFPMYHEVLPPNREYSRSITLARVAFRNAIKECAVMANQNYLGVKLDIQPPGKNEVTISTKNPEIGANTVNLEILKYTGKEWPFEVSFNAKYLIEAMDALEKSTVKLDLISDCSPLRVRENNFEAYVMPMRL